MRALMAAVRLVAGGLVARAPLLGLTGAAPALEAAAAAPLRYLLATLLACGIVAFAWPASCYAGAGILTAGVGLFAWLADRAGLGYSRQLPWSLAVIGVLAGREWANERLERLRQQG